MSSKEVETRKKIVHEMQEHPLMNPNQIAKRLKIPKSTVYRTIKKFNDILTIERS